jgi:hypothetical protein
MRISLYYTMACYSIAKQTTTIADPRRRYGTDTATWLMRLLIGGHLVVFAGAAYTFLHLPSKPAIVDLAAEQQYAMGLTCVFLLVLFYVSPLTELYQVRLDLGSMATNRNA